MIRNEYEACSQIKQEEVHIKEEIIESPPQQENPKIIEKPEDNENFKCEDEFNSNSENLNSHVTDGHHGKDSETNRLPKSGGSHKVFHCKYCTFSTKWKQCWNVHVVRKHKSEEDVKMFYCAECDYKAKFKRYLSSHIQRVHLKKSKKRFKCNECDYTSRYTNSLSEHVICKHTPDELIEYFHCKQCDFKSKTQTSLKRHETKHSGIRFPCEYCKFVTRHKSLLRSHFNRMHLKKDADRYKCKECSYKACTLGSVKLHVIAKHTPANEIQYFYCDQCTYKAKFKNLLKNHILINHLKHRAHHCTQCTYSATRRHCLKRHIMLKHTPEEEWKYFYCEHCNYKSVRRQQLKLHTRRHIRYSEQEGWEKCPYCKAGPRTKYELKDLKEHIKREHPEKIVERLHVIVPIRTY